ncbi:MAG: hypothetical protein U0289_04590 [Cyclobacteriaceae bacterium]|nr:hypothetical protein [Cytophagales bacterium]HNP78507.1 hypothetical protein [Cyclobacteriaceae bacterium]
MKVAIRLTGIINISKVNYFLTLKLTISSSSELTRLWRAGLVLTALWVAIPSTVWAQEEDESTTFPLKNFYAEIKKRPQSIFRNFRFGASVGYGQTYFSHNLNGYVIYQPTAGAPELFGVKDTGASRYSNWVNQSAVDNNALVPGSFRVSSDTAKLGFRGKAFNIPLRLTIHYEFLKRYRIGAGYSYELMSIGALQPYSYGDKIKSFQPPNASGWMSKYFGYAGVSFYRTGNYLFTGDLQVGSYNPGSNFDAGIQKGVFFNIGVTVERELSEYLRVFVRPSFEIKSYTLNLPAGPAPISHSMNAAYLNIGFTYSIPDLPKCKKHDCKIQMNHAHGDREYRSRVHPIYKKQNPLYGENHPKLFRYKGKNKKKLNPY